MNIREYLKKRIMVIGVFLVCSMIYPVVLFLYGADTEPVWYGLVLCISVLLIVGCTDMVLLKRRHKKLLNMDPLTGQKLAEVLPPADFIERDYQELIQRLSEQIAQINTDSELYKRELEDFYALWVHQIKTPIAALRLLLQTNPENIKDMRNELFKIERYVEIVLGYLRMKDINQDMRIQKCSLEDMVSLAVKKYSSLFIAGHIGLRMESLSEAVLTDEKWMVFVLEQLISNAVKYTPAGEITIFSKTEEIDKMQCTTLTIRDTGIGIYPEDLPRIFEKSFTGYNGRMDKKASGLGLYLCNTVIRKLGHAIKIDSVPGEGTAVKLIFTERKY